MPTKRGAPKRESTSAEYRGRQALLILEAVDEMVKGAQVPGEWMEGRENSPLGRVTALVQHYDALKYYQSQMRTQQGNRIFQLPGETR